MARQRRTADSASQPGQWARLTWVGEVGGGVLSEVRGLLSASTCLAKSEQRRHLDGSLGTALADRLFTETVIRQAPGGPGRGLWRGNLPETLGWRT